ncbi:MAG: hypothetical protein V9E84_10195 [Trichococcus flocculiformis]
MQIRGKPREYKPAPRMMPTLIDQKRKTKSSGSLMAVRKRTMERAPTIPRERTTLDVTARMTKVVRTDSRTNDVLKGFEYMTPA